MLCYTSQKDLMNATTVIQAQIVGSCSDFGKTNDCLCYASPPRRNQLDWLCQEILLGFHRCLEHQCDLRVGHLCSGKRGRLPRVVVDGSYLDHVRSNDSNTLKTVEDSQEFPSGPASNFMQSPWLDGNVSFHYPWQRFEGTRLSWHPQPNRGPAT